MEYDFPVSVDQGMEDGEVPLYGDGDGHEDAGAEEDVVEGVEEVGEQVVMDLGHHSSDAGRISTVILKCSPYTLRDADDQEEIDKTSKVVNSKALYNKSLMKETSRVFHTTIRNNNGP